MVKSMGREFFSRTNDEVELLLTVSVYKVLDSPPVEPIMKRMQAIESLLPNASVFASPY